MSRRVSRRARLLPTAADLAQRKLQTGMKVQLVTDKTPMIVDIISDGLATCVWLDKTGKDRSRAFPVTALKPMSEDFANA